MSCELVLVDRDVQRPRRVQRALAEARDLLERAAAQPGERPRRQRLGRAASPCARASISSATSGNWRVNAWLAAAARLNTTRWSPRVMLDVISVTDGPGIEAQLAGLAVDRMHRVRVGRVREDRVVRPAELLDRRAVARRELARLALDAGEVQPAAEPLVRPVAAAALEREAEQPGALGGHDVEGEDHAGRAGVRLDRDPVGLADGAHGASITNGGRHGVLPHTAGARPHTRHRTSHAVPLRRLVGRLARDLLDRQRDRRIDVHEARELGQLQPAVDRQRELADQLAGARRERVRADDPALRGDDPQLALVGALGPGAVGVRQVLAPDAHVAVAVLGARLCLRQPGVRELGIGERAPRHEEVAAAGARQEHVAHGARGLVAGGVREQVAPRDVARRVDRAHARAQPAVDLIPRGPTFTPTCSSPSPSTFGVRPAPTKISAAVHERSPAWTVFMPSRRTVTRSTSTSTCRSTPSARSRPAAARPARAPRASAPPRPSAAP